MRRPYSLKIFSALLLILLLIPSEPLRAQACSVNWRSLPKLLPSPSFVSPNDPEIVYRDTIIRSRRGAAIWGAHLRKAMRTGVLIRSQLARWQSSLEDAERNFWAAYDRTGVVDRRLADEYTYWLHKREAWLQVKTNIAFELKSSLGGNSGALASFVLGGNGDTSFVRPHEFSTTNDITIRGGPSDHLGDQEYKDHFRKLVQLGFLKHSRCTPSRTDGDRGRLVEALFYPFASSQSVDQQINRTSQYLARSPDETWATISDLVLKAISDYPDGPGASILLERYIESGTPGLLSEVQTMFNYQTRRQWQLRQIKFDEKLRIADNFSINFNSLRRRVSFGTIDAEAMRSCVYDNWSTIQDYVFQQNPKFFNRAFLSVGEETNAIGQEFTLVVLQACAHPQGLESPDVQKWLSLVRAQ